MSIVFNIIKSFSILIYNYEIFYNNLGIPKVIVCFYCTLIDLINDYKNHKKYFLLAILFYGDNVCLGGLRGVFL